MAGSSTNWFQVGRGSAKGRVFVSNATLQSQPGDGSVFMKARIASGLASSDPDLRQAATDGILQLSAMSAQPKGQARNAIKEIAPRTFHSAAPASPSPPARPSPPRGWAQSAAAQDMIGYQTMALEYRSMDNAKNPADLMLRDAFERANPRMPTWERGEYETIMDAKPREENGDAPGLEQLWSYTKNGFRAINASLWAGRREPSGEISFPSGGAYGDELRASRKIQDLLLGLSAPFDMTVTRGVARNHELAAWANSASVGDSYINQGFDSSSIDPNIDVYGNDVQLKMRIPAGSRGGYINSIFPGTSNSEQEWLVPANSSWTVTGKRVLPNGKLEVTVDLVDQRNFDGSLVWP